jgi:dTDP-4-amino-4,6-dideoxygalactose transaminase
VDVHFGYKEIHRATVSHMIPYGRHSINQADIDAVVKALRSEWLTTGPLVEQFESALESIVGAPCISVSSGTAALHCAYAAIGLKPGDEVITPPITFIATQATAAFFGANIVFADVQSDTANIDPSAVEGAITSRTKAIVAVDYAGHPADLTELRRIADKHGVYLIEDAAHSIGSTYRDRTVGSIADLTTFSFFPTKNMTSAEGGAVASIHPELLIKAKRFSRQGLVRNSEEFIMKNEGPWHQEVHEFGLNYRLPDVLCALGISQLDRLNDFKRKKMNIFDQYNAAFAQHEELIIPSSRPYVDVNWHLYPLRVSSEHRLEIFEQLKFSGVSTQVNYIPAYLHPVFRDKGYKLDEYPNSYEFYKSEISIPMSSSLTDREVAFVIEKLGFVLSKLI